MGLVLVISDRKNKYDEFYRNLSFQGEGIKVHPFSDAPDVVKDCQIDVILLDCNVDIDAGLKLLRENKVACPTIPNIFITDTSFEGVVLKAFRAGARDFFRKPVDIHELQDTVEGLLKVKRISKEKRSPFIKSNT